MSHFNVLVFTEGKPDEEILHEILAPWHEFECTGTDNQYVQDIDITDEARKEYETDTERRFKDPQGNLHDPYQDEERFYREKTAEEKEAEPWIRNKVLELPAGWEDVKVPTKDVKTFIEWIKDWYGYKPVTTQQVRLETFAGSDGPITRTAAINGAVNWDEIKYGFALVQSDNSGYTPPKDRTVLKVIKRTNPDKKWDWWQIGGRFSNKFTTEKIEDNPNNWETCFQCNGTGMRNDDLGRKQRAIDPSYTCNGCNGNGNHLKWPTDWQSTGDQAHLASLNYDTLKKKAVQEREDWIKSIIEKTHKRAGTDYTREQIEIALQLNKTSHAEWMQLPEPKPRGNEYADWISAKGGDYPILADVFKSNWELPDINSGQSLQEWIEAAPAIQCFAVVKDGKWYERGEMGWWGVVVGEKDHDEWNAQLDKLLKDYTDNTWVTSIDCHI
jgi:hypothetical protein